MATERSFSRQARINAPPQQVWDFMTNLSNSPKWISGVSESKVITPGPMAAGSVIKETRTIGNRTETYDIKVTRFEPPKVYGAGVQAGKAEFGYTFELKEAEGGTDITMQATARGRGLMTKLFIGVGMKFMEKHDGEQLQHLKKAIEGGA